MPLVRDRIRAAHDVVPSGHYAEAHAAFAAWLPHLVAHLGDEHPEVLELREDLDAVRDMAGVAAFRREAGFRDPGVHPMPSDPGEEPS